MFNLVTMDLKVLEKSTDFDKLVDKMDAGFFEERTFVITDEELEMSLKHNNFTDALDFDLLHEESKEFLDI